MGWRNRNCSDRAQAEAQRPEEQDTRRKPADFPPQKPGRNSALEMPRETRAGMRHGGENKGLGEFVRSNPRTPDRLPLPLLPEDPVQVLELPCQEINQRVSKLIGTRYKRRW